MVEPLDRHDLEFLGQVGTRAELGHYDYQRFQKIMEKLWKRRCYDDAEQSRLTGAFVGANGKTEVWSNGKLIGVQG